jgi:cobalt-zinc-cadmium efflux system outer membrane protein
MRKKIRIALAALIVAFSSPSLQAQSFDTLALTVRQAETQFLSRNLALLAGKYGIEMSKAAEIQAGLWPNPNVRIEQNVFNPGNKQWFDAGYTGQNAFEIDQLILTAGKRNKQLRIAKAGTKMSEFDFQDLLRTLKRELHQSFYGLYFQDQKIAVYNEEIVELSRLVVAYDSQFSKGNVPKRDVARLRAQLFALESERLNLKQDQLRMQSEMRMFLQDTVSYWYKPVVDGEKIDKAYVKQSPVGLIESALNNRPDLNYYKSNIELAEARLSLERALAVPDIQVGYLYDRQGSFVRDYQALTLTMPLPLFNRNQGTIKLADAQRKQAMLLLQQYQQKVITEVQSQWYVLEENQRLYQSFDKNFLNEYDNLLNGFMENFRKHNLTMIEFIDFLDTYKESRNRFYQLSLDRINAIENLNFYTGTNVITVE